MLQHNIELLVTKARQSNAQPIPERVHSEREGKLLISQIETHLEGIGFYPFDDIEADNNNNFCIRSRHSFRLIGGRHKVWASIRLHTTRNGVLHVSLQIQ